MGKKISYVLDMDNIMKFVFDSDSKRDMDSEITEVYVADDETNEFFWMDHCWTGKGEPWRR